MMTQDLSKLSKPVEAEMNQFIKLYKESLSSSNVLLNQVIEHVTQKPGKMMRPLLLFLITKYFGKVTPVAYHAAVSLELLHTATLIHDDVVDESNDHHENGNDEQGHCCGFVARLAYREAIFGKIHIRQ